MTTITPRSEFKKEKVTSDFFVRSHFVNNLKKRFVRFFYLTLKEYKTQSETAAISG